MQARRGTRQRARAPRQTAQATAERTIEPFDVGCIDVARTLHRFNNGGDDLARTLIDTTGNADHATVFVLSSRTLVPALSGVVVQHLSEPPAEIVSQLAARGLRHVYVDGGITIQQFLRAGLIQRLIITRVLVLIGDGIPLLGALPGDVRLHHVATRYLPSDLVQSAYHIGDTSGQAEDLLPLWYQAGEQES